MFYTLDTQICVTEHSYYLNFYYGEKNDIVERQIPMHNIINTSAVTELFPNIYTI